MSSRQGIPDFRASALRAQAALGIEAAHKLLDAGRAWDLAPVLRAGGALIFPHVSLTVCGHHLAAAIHACLDAGVKKVLAVGVLHALNDDLQAARVRVAGGGEVRVEPAWGIQGPGLDAGRQDWRNEFSMLNFEYLWRLECARRGIAGPELILRFPYLAGGRPHILPGIAELQALVAEGAAVVGTADPFHHGLAYNDPPERALPAEEGGLALARMRIEEGLGLLRAGDYWGYNQHCVDAKSDARDVGQVIRYLLGPLQGEIHDLLWEDMSGPYGKPAPSWVSGALISLARVARRSGDLA
ncbi:MAG: hypothetical protein K1X39_10215 [Thermoflexales bacterium]|nr:hypothetical protein [Thermoflexales bacterium]